MYAERRLMQVDLTHWEEAARPRLFLLLAHKDLALRTLDWAEMDALLQELLAGAAQLPRGLDRHLITDVSHPMHMKKVFRHVGAHLPPQARVP